MISLNDYTDYYNDIISKDIGEDDIENLVEKLNINIVVDTLLKKTKFTPEDITLMEVIIRILQYLYNNTSYLPPVQDNDYDELYELYRDKTHTEIVGSIQARDKIIDYHEYQELRGSLHKIHYVENHEKKDKRRSLEDFIKSSENILGRRLTDDESIIRLTPKWDGISVIFEIDTEGNIIKALTRGDVEKNEAVNITALFRNVDMKKYIPDYMSGKKGGLKTECIMPLNVFDEYCSKYGKFNNTRSAVSSIINSNELNPELMNYLQIMPIQIQEFDSRRIYVPESFFSNYIQYVCSIYKADKIREAIKEIYTHIVDYAKLPIDGIVISFVDEKVQQLLGRDSNINLFEVAYKFPAERKKTKLVNVEFSIGKVGSITPVAKVEPVIMNGNTITSISLGSPERFVSLDLRKGDEVIIQYDIVPYLLKDDTCKQGKGDKFIIPERCPYCNKKLEMDPVLKCVNTECPSRQIGKILTYIDKVGIPNISIATVTTLFNLGFLKSITDLYELENHKKELAKIEGYGELSVNKIIEGIKLRDNLFEHQLLGSLAIPNIGVRMFDKVLKVYSLDELMQICDNNEINKLVSIPGIQLKTANKIIEGVKENESIIKYLISKLKVTREVTKSYKVKVCFTKIRDKDFEKYLESIGVGVSEKYSKKDIDILIIPDNHTSSDKIDKAKDHGKEILTIDEAYKLFKYKK